MMPDWMPSLFLLVTVGMCAYVLVAGFRWLFLEKVAPEGDGQPALSEEEDAAFAEWFMDQPDAPSLTTAEGWVRWRWTKLRAHVDAVEAREALFWQSMEGDEGRFERIEPPEEG